MKEIIALTDYKGLFGSKWNANPYRSGMDQDLLKKHFNQLGYSFKTMKFSEFDYSDKSNAEKIIIYTSSEDNGYIYKDYIEDIILGAQELGCNLLPQFKFLRANNNKVFMEILRDIIIPDNKLKSFYLSAVDNVFIDKLKYPIIMKESSGAMSKGVTMNSNSKELKKNIRRINRTDNLIQTKEIIKDFTRGLKHKGYIKDSLNRKKFILQEVIPNLNSDYKIIVFGNKYYICERPLAKNDFRASGGNSKNFTFGSKVQPNMEIFNFAKKIYEHLDVANISLDICDNGSEFSLFEFQAIYFGSSVQFKSDGHYEFAHNKWKFIKSKFDLEEVYAESIDYYLNK
jgi:glutathione synthase/RimK-type ligase-like ATP-grasp enzyme